MGPDGVNDDGSIFPGKSNPLQTHFLSRLLSGALSILMFVYKAGTSIKKRDFLFNIMCGKFRFDGQHGALPVLVAVTKKFFSFLGRMVLFLSFFFGSNFFFIFFFTKDFLPLLIFPWARASTCEFCKVHAVKKKYGNYMKEEPHHKRLPSNQRKIDVYGLWRLEVTLQSRSFAYQLEYVSIKALWGRSVFWFVFNSA